MLSLTFNLAAVGSIYKMVEGRNQYHVHVTPQIQILNSIFCFVLVLVVLEFELRSLVGKALYHLSHISSPVCLFLLGHINCT
jgi:hypothetical protein